jgi:hypothetical protein
MDANLEDAYFNWLCAKVVPPPGLDDSYWELLKILDNTEFVWLVIGDDNRAQDGIDLRDRFLREAVIGGDPEWPAVMCSVLEMLVAFAYKAEFQTDDSIRSWFWEFMDNLHLALFTDDHMEYEAVEEILYRFIWREYRIDGTEGGLFPLRNTLNDQRKVELWYQFSEYILENERIF